MTVIRTFNRSSEIFWTKKTEKLEIKKNFVSENGRNSPNILAPRIFSPWTLLGIEVR